MNRIFEALMPASYVKRKKKEQEDAERSAKVRTLVQWLGRAVPDNKDDWPEFQKKHIETRLEELRREAARAGEPLDRVRYMVWKTQGAVVERCNMTPAQKYWATFEAAREAGFKVEESVCAEK